MIAVSGCSSVTETRLGMLVLPGISFSQAAQKHSKCNQFLLDRRPQDREARNERSHPVGVQVRRVDVADAMPELAILVQPGSRLSLEHGGPHIRHVEAYLAQQLGVPGFSPPRVPPSSSSAINSKMRSRAE